MEREEWLLRRKEEAERLIKLVKPGELIKVKFNGATGLAQFVRFDGEYIIGNRWLDSRKRIRPNMRIYLHQLISIADPDEARTKRALAAFRSQPGRFAPKNITEVI